LFAKSALAGNILSRHNLNVILTVPVYFKQISPDVLKLVRARCKFGQFSLEDHFPEQLRSPEVPFLNRGEQCISWTPDLHTMFCESLGSKINPFVFCILLCIQRRRASSAFTVLPVPVEVLSMILQITSPLFIIPIYHGIWHEPALVGFLRNLAKHSCISYPTYFPKCFQVD
jgi:hypothetical protein